MAGREPIYDDCRNHFYGAVGFVGEIFTMGAAGGAAFHLVRGLVGSPSGARLAGAVSAALANTPRVAGTVGAYATALCTAEAAVSHARGKDDIWSSVFAAAATWSLHGVCRGGGSLAAARGALLGAAGALALKGLDHATDVWAQTDADADSLLRQKLMKDSGQPTPVAIAASWTAAAHPIDGPTSVAILYGKYE